MRRRTFIAALGGAAAWPVAARAQQHERMRRVGVLMNGAATDAVRQTYAAALVEGLRERGWIEGQNLQIDFRWSAGDAELARIYAAQLIGFVPDVIVTATTTNLIAVRQATNTVPIVFLQVSDPVAQGFVSNVVKPGGNLTGFSAFEFSIGGKWLDLLKAISPSLEHAWVMFNPDTSPQSKFFVRSVEAAAPGFAVQSITAYVRSTADFESAFETMARTPNSGLILTTDTFTAMREDVIIDLANRHRMPAISGGSPRFPKDGGLLYYGIVERLPDQFRQAGSYVGRILNGANPGELPIQQPDKYSLIINLKTAKTIGLVIPLSLVARADEVIE
jgi:putative ABC transport system substrate-binding protein